MTTSDYSISFPYGATDGVYYYTPTAAKPKTSKWIANYHRGDDRVMPIGTPVVVNGVVIGLSGNTGASSAPHLHIGRFINGVVQNPGSGGFSLPNATVFDTGYDATNGNYVRIMSQGALWVYLHFSKVSVAKGQVVQFIGGKGAGTLETTQGDPTMSWPMTKEEVTWVYRTAGGVDPAPSEIEAYVGKDYAKSQAEIQRYFVNKGLDFYTYKKNQGTDKQLTTDDVSFLVKLVARLTK